MTDPRPLPYDPRQVRQALQDRLPDLLARLRLQDDRPGNLRDPQRIYPRSPLRDDRSAGSFVIWTSGDRRGAWKDYAVPHHHGDVYGLIQATQRLVDWIDAYWWALDFLGWARRGNEASPRTKARMLQQQEQRAAEAAAEAARQDAAEAERSKALFEFWLGCKTLPGTPAERYLREARAIPLERLARSPDAIRWAELYEHVDADGEVHEWRHVMVTAMTRGAKVSALHFTFLRPDGSGKADRAKAKLMLGAVRGAAIRLARGPSNLSPSAASRAGKTSPLAIGEGIETCLTVAAARPDYRVWAAGSLSLMGLLEWPACASAIVLLAENDWKPEAVNAFAAVEEHWRRQARGRPVLAVSSAVGSDFNDWARKAS